MIFLSQKILHTQERRKANWIGRILCRNCSLQTCYWRKDRGKDRCDGKMKYTATGWP